MSLKAYDGMMTRNGVKYLYDKFEEYLPELKDVSLNKLGKVYADLIVKYADENCSITRQLEWEANNEISLKKQLKEIDMKDIPIISLIHQAGKILSNGYYRNDFMVHLTAEIQPIENDKILVYPSLVVQEHKKVLLKFLTDWYAQDQVDDDEDVPGAEWDERCADWWNFGETRGLSFKINIFEPGHYWDGLNNDFRGDEMYEYVFKHIPSDEDRIRKVVFNKLLDVKIETYPKEEKSASLFINLATELKSDTNTEIDDYIKNNKIELSKIDKDYLKTIYIEPVKDETK